MAKEEILRDNQIIPIPYSDGVKVKKFEDYDTSLESIAPTRHPTYFITGYDGDYILSKKPTYGCTRPSTQKLRGGDYAFPAGDSGGNKKQSILKKLGVLFKKNEY